MKKIIICSVLAVVILGVIIFGFVKCSKDSPSDVVVKHIELLSEGKYSDVKKMFNESSEKLVSDDSKIREYGDGLTCKKTVKKIEIVKEKIEDEETATVEFKILHKGGSAIEARYTLVKAKDGWKIDLQKIAAIEKTAEENKTYKEPDKLEGFWIRSENDIIKITKSGDEYISEIYSSCEELNYDSNTDVFKAKHRYDFEPKKENLGKKSGPWVSKNMWGENKITKDRDTYSFSTTDTSDKKQYECAWIEKINKLFIVSTNIKDNKFTGKWEDDGSLVLKGKEEQKFYYVQELDAFYKAKEFAKESFFTDNNAGGDKYEVNMGYKFEGRTKTKESKKAVFKRIETFGEEQ